MRIIWQQMTRRSNWECVGTIHEVPPFYGLMFDTQVLRNVCSAGKPDAAAWRERNPEYAIGVTSDETDTCDLSSIHSRKPSDVTRRYDLAMCVDVWTEVDKLNRRV